MRSFRLLRALLTGILLLFATDPSQAQHTAQQRPESSTQSLWARYQSAPDTETGQQAGRKALRQWTVASNAARLNTLTKTLPPDADLWPVLVQALTTVYRTSDDPPAFRDGYEAMLKRLKQRVTDAEGWLTVMIALGDYYRTVEQDRWKALEAYETAYQQGGSQRLIATLKTRLESLRLREIGTRAPTFQVTTMADSTIDLASLRGDPVLLYFWARWCSPCLWKLPKLSALQSTYRDLHLLGLITDVGDRRKLRTYLENKQIDWPQAVTANWAQATRSPERLYGVGGPGPPIAPGHLVLIDRQGRIAAQGKDLDAIRDALRTIGETQASKGR